MKYLQISSQHRFIIFSALAFVQFVVQTSALFKGADYVVSALTFDDAYYYFQTAWNLNHLGIPTFDGVTPTNGVQLLWFGIVFFLSYIAQTKIELLLLSMATCFLFNAADHLAIWNVSETLHRPWLGIYMSSFWFLLTFGSEFYSTGMENSLHAFVFWLTIWATLAFLDETNPRKKNHKLILLSIMLILNVWARLDAAIFSVTLYIYCLLKMNKRDHVGHILISALLALCGLVIQLSIFYLMGGSWLPVSSLVKQTWSNWGDIYQLSATRLLGVLFLLPILEILIQRYTRQQTLLRGVWYSLLVGVIIHVIITGGLNAYERFLWYLSPSFVFLTLTLAYLGDGLSQIVAQFAPRASKAIPAGVSLPLIALAIFLFYVRLHLALPTYKLGYRSALWISDQLPADVKLASWNAGIIGYFSGRTVINLDGLINGIDYYQDVIAGQTSWMEYVKEQDVEYVIDYSRNYVTSPEFQVITVFSLSTDDQTEVIMWQVPGHPAAPYRHITFLEK